jgi:hypothetical protein
MHLRCTPSSPTCPVAGLGPLLLLGLLPRRPAPGVQLPARPPGGLVPAHRQLHVEDAAQQREARVGAGAWPRRRGDRRSASHALAVPVALHPGPAQHLLIPAPAPDAPLLPLAAAAAAVAAEAGGPARQRALQGAGGRVKALLDRCDVVAARPDVPALLLRVLQGQRPGCLWPQPGAPLAGDPAAQHADRLVKVAEVLPKPGAGGRAGAVGGCGRSRWAMAAAGCCAGAWQGPPKHQWPARQVQRAAWQLRGSPPPVQEAQQQQAQVAVPGRLGGRQVAQVLLLPRQVGQRLTGHCLAAQVRLQGARGR